LQCKHPVRDCPDSILVNNCHPYFTLLAKSGAFCSVLLKYLIYFPIMKCDRWERVAGARLILLCRFGI
jgi:hypothetical protein